MEKNLKKQEIGRNKKPKNSKKISKSAVKNVKMR
jgi:hypothetical protein